MKFEADDALVPGVEGNCRFPEFLYPSPRGRRLTYVWTTETRYRAGSAEADKQLEVTVRDRDTLVTKLRHSGGLCVQRQSNVSCRHREFLYQRRCLEYTDNLNKFIIEHNDGTCVNLKCFFWPREEYDNARRSDIESDYNDT